MTDPRDAFLRAIEQDFDSDLPRLVFADWLDENGEPDRAAFIRVQCETNRMIRTYAELLPPDERVRYARMMEAAAQLQEAHAEGWTDGLPDWARRGHFVRGFMAVTSVTATQLLSDGEQVRQTTPIGGRLEVAELDGHEVGVFGRDLLAGVTELQLGAAGLTDAGAERLRLAAGPHLRQVRRIDLHRPAGGWRRAPENRLTNDAVRALAATDGLPALTALYLNGHAEITTAGAASLLESPLRSGLTVLGLSADPGAPSVADAFRMARTTELIVLDLSGRSIGDSGAAVLARCPALSRLTELYLRSTGLTDAGVLAVLESPCLQNVRVLNLTGNDRVTDRSARVALALARPWRHLWFDGPGMTEDVLSAIRARCEEPR